LPRGAYVINTARGPCVDANGLLESLESGRVAYAALDVVETEPLDDERIRNHPRIVLTPHTAFYSVEGHQEMRSKGAEEARRILLGEAVRNPVNLHVLKDARCRVS
jgi:C-terminal binding protein